MRKKCSYCGGTAIQCRCPSSVVQTEVVETERLMSLSQRRGRLVKVPQPQALTDEEREMIAFENRFKDQVASRSL